MSLDKILSEYVGSIHESLINFESITQYLNFIDKYKSGRRCYIKSIIFSKLILDPELQLLSSYLEFFHLNSILIATAS